MLTFNQKAQAYFDAQRILENFDFWKVQKAMQALNWTYWDSENTPSVQRLKEMAEYVINSCLDEMQKFNNNEYYSSCGGFTVTASTVDNGLVMLKLTFNIEEGDNYELH